jgi:hypothetical protein
MVADTIGDVRADLSRRVGAIEWRGGPRGLAMEVDAIRTVARRHGLMPATVVAEALEAALGRGEQGPLIHAWLQLLRDAIASERQDRGAADSYAAACTVRLAG